MMQKSHLAVIADGPVILSEYVREALKEDSKAKAERIRNQCIKCRYYIGKPSIYHCNYSFVNKHSRGCSPINCIKFEPSDGKKRKKPDNTIKHRREPEILDIDPDLQDPELKYMYMEGY